MRFRQLLVFLLATVALIGPAQGRDLVARTPLALETFDEVWRILHETHFDTNFNGHNWNEVREKYRPKAAAARNPDALRDVLQEMIDLLAVSHMAIVPGDFVAELEDTKDEKPAGDEGGASLERADEDESGTLGMQLRYVDKHLLVTRVEPDLPAAVAGVKPGWILERIGSTATADLKQKTPKKLDARRRDFLAWRAAANKLSGAPRTKITLQFLDHRNSRVSLQLERSVAQGEPIQFGTLPVLYAHLDDNTVKSPDRMSVV